MAPNDPKVVTISGRLSWPVFKYADAVVRNQKSQYPLPTESVTPEFNLLIEQPMLDKYLAFVYDEFFPAILAENALDNKKGLDKAAIDRLKKIIDAQAWEDQPPYIPIKAVPEKTAEMAPEAVAMLKIKGNRGVDVNLMAVVNGDSEFDRPEFAEDILSYPVIKPIGQTVHNLYAGCIAAATLNHYGYMSGKLPGFSASASTCVFKLDADRFGGGVDVDEDAIFMDD